MLSAAARSGCLVIYSRPRPLRVIMKCMAYCELCEMDREFCEHGLGERR